MSQQSQQVFSGRYELLGHVARGGMAEVYLAQDLMLNRKVALKVLFRELSTDASFVERFRREAQAAANLSHPNIVSIYDWGEEDGTYFIVMEYIEGRTLGQIIRAEGPLLPDRAADIGADVAAALAFAHHSGVVHRDVKPGNVLISPSGQVKVTDFGIARAANADNDLTQTGAVMGTATYFSPEQAQGMRVDGRSDVYSLGVMLYEMLVGRPPFQGDNPMAIAYKHVREQPVPPREINSDVPAPFEAIILQAMAKNPNDRYASADELRQDLLRFRQGRLVVAHPTVMAPAVEPASTMVTPAVDRTTTTRRTTSTTRPSSPKRGTGAFVLLLLVMLAALAGLIFLLAKQTGWLSDSNTAKVTMPAVTGQPLADATRTVEAAHLKVQEVDQPNEAPAGTVYQQDPLAGQKADRGAPVTLFVSKGIELVPLNNVVGMDAGKAKTALEDLGLKVTIKEQTDTKAPKNQVIAQDPPATAKATIAKGTTVTLTVSSGKAQTSIPDVTGLEAADAANELGQAGFKTTTKQEPSATVDQGKVIRTDPAAGTNADAGSTVTIFVSSGPDMTTVPNVIGMTEDQARAQIEGVGLKMAVGAAAPSDSANDGKVVSQNPSGSTKVPPGSTVTVRIGHAGLGTGTT